MDFEGQQCCTIKTESTGVPPSLKHRKCFPVPRGGIAIVYGLVANSRTCIIYSCRSIADDHILHHTYLPLDYTISPGTKEAAASKMDQASVTQSVVKEHIPFSNTVFTEVSSEDPAERLVTVT